MAIDGIYSITFRGAADWGMGLLLFQNHSITGADVGGVLYDGNFSETGENITADVNLKVPPGVTLVQGTVPSPKETEFSFSATIPKRAMSTQEPVLVMMPVGPVNVIFRCLRSL